MKTIESRKIVKELSRKYNIPEQEVNLIINSPFEFILTHIREDVDRENGKYPSFRVSNLGRFYVPKNVVYYVQKKLKESGGE